jgi:hypothetical protein
MRVVFNVGGTRFETLVSTLQQVSWRDTDVLNMLVRRHFIEEKGGEIFIDHDPSSFQQILNHYRRNGPMCEDPDELGFYNIPQPQVEVEIEEKSKRQKIEEELTDVRKKRIKEENKKVEMAYDRYAQFMQLILKHGCQLEFVYAENGNDFSTVPSTLDGVHYPQEKLPSYHDQLLVAYAKSLGYQLVISTTREDKSTKYLYPPASFYNGSYTPRKKACVTLKLQILL